MKAPGHITTVAIATIATVVLATVALALATPAVSGPDDSELPVIATGVSPDAAGAGASVPDTTTPGPSATGDDAGAHDDADDHETVAPEVRVEDDDDHEAEPSEHPDDGESSEQHSDTDDTHE